jgi:hypothetical protein
MSKATTNLAASVRQRLLNLARTRNEDFGLLLTKYALERLLFRITAKAIHFVFKQSSKKSAQPQSPKMAFSLILKMSQLRGSKKMPTMKVCGLLFEHSWRMPGFRCRSI